jgi:hypothetical protein
MPQNDGYHQTHKNKQDDRHSEVVLNKTTAEERLKMTARFFQVL